MGNMKVLPRPILAFVFAVILVAMLGGVLAWIGSHLQLNRLEMTLPTLVIVGVFALLMSLTIVAIALSILGLADKNQALALPEGSVRAVIALMLIVLFAIISIYLYNNLSGTIQSVDSLSQDDLTAFKQSANTVILVTQDAAPVNGAPRFKVFFQEASSAAAQDFAKQMLVLLGTLVTAVSSFYFGANSVASAVANASKTPAPQPKISETTPRSLKRDDTLQDLKIIGEDLANINSVRLVRAGEEVVATEVASADAQVTCKVRLTSAQSAGKWDVIVSDSNSQAKLTTYLDVA